MGGNIKTTNHGPAEAHITIYSQNSGIQLDHGPNIPGQTRTWTCEDYKSYRTYEIRVEVNGDKFNIDRIYRCQGGSFVEFKFGYNNPNNIIFNER